MPPKPSTPPTSATPVVPSAATGAAGAVLVGATKAVSEKASQLGGLVRRQTPAIIGAAVAAGVVVTGLLIWWLTSLGGSTNQPVAEASAAATTTSSAPASRGPLPLEGVSPLDFQLGDCFKDFDPNATQATVVACETGHSAQLIATETYPAPDSYPGRDPLKKKALDACQGAPLTDKSAQYVLSYKLAYPSSTSWDKGDRRVDCFATADTGNVIMESLLSKP